MGKIRDAIDRLAAMYEYGQLEAQAAPHDFLDMVTSELTLARAVVDAAREIAVCPGWGNDGEHCCDDSDREAETALDKAIAAYDAATKKEGAGR